MKQFYIWIAIFSFYQDTVIAQSCPLNSTSSVSSNPNTFYPANQANVNSGTSSIALGAVTSGYGTMPISSGDILLVIQMQGAQISSLNSNKYGSGSSAGNGSGYLNNGNLLAGTMEYVVASNNVPLTGGTLNLASALVNSYKNTPFGTDGQYTYQVVRVPVYYDLTLTGSIPIAAPRWDGKSGGMVVLYATNNINLNAQTIDASGFGFRGGGGRAFTGSGSGSSSDYITSSVSNANGGKGEGIAGTPKYLNDNNSFLDVSASEGYPNGSYGRGAPGNAGGGGTDGNPAANNDENTGGGGGANGGAGGNGGNAWSSATPSGGKPGSVFTQASPSRLVMGGGGGAGTTNDATGIPKLGFASSGVAGGGIIILVANSINGPGIIKANGASGNNSVVNDGAGGAGAGGSILIYSNNTSNLSTVTVTAKGGIGGSNEVVKNTSTNNPAHGPGGGGGGGIIYANAPLSTLSSVSGGTAGFTSVNTTHYGATDGSLGVFSTTTTQIQTPKFPLTCIVLPVTFLDLAADQDNGLVTIKWDVAQQVNTLEYMVEKSEDGINFTAIGSVPRQSGTADKAHYEYPDNSGFDKSGIVYYRIKEVEASGQSMYSKIVSTQAGGLSGKLSVYPNPAKESVTVSFISLAQTTISLRLFDLKGSVIWQQQYQAHAGQNNVIIDNIRTLSNGMYILQCSDGSKPEQVKLLVNH